MLAADHHLAAGLWSPRGVNHNSADGCCKGIACSTGVIRPVLRRRYMYNELEWLVLDGCSWRLCLASSRLAAGAGACHQSSLHPEVATHCAGRSGGRGARVRRQQMRGRFPHACRHGWECRRRGGKLPRVATVRQSHQMLTGDVGGGDHGAGLNLALYHRISCNASVMCRGRWASVRLCMSCHAGTICCH